MSGSDSSGLVSRWVSNRTACAGSAAPVCAESSTGRTGTVEAGGREKTCGSSSVAGGSSMITCALVPLSPNEEIPARRGRPEAGQGTGSASRRTAPDDQSTFGEGSSTCSVLGRTP